MESPSLMCANSMIPWGCTRNSVLRSLSLLLLSQGCLHSGPRASGTASTDSHTTRTDRRCLSATLTPGRGTRAVFTHCDSADWGAEGTCGWAQDRAECCRPSSWNPILTPAKLEAFPLAFCRKLALGPREGLVATWTCGEDNPRHVRWDVG